MRLTAAPIAAVCGGERSGVAVEAHDHLAIDRSCGQHSFPLRQERHTDADFAKLPLEAAQVIVARGGRGVGPRS